jgi:hypothetical protein
MTVHRAYEYLKLVLQGTDEKCIQRFDRKLKEKDRLKDLYVDESIISD